MTLSLPKVTVVIPTIPRRRESLLRAIHSVEQQTYPRELVDTHIVMDSQGLGPAAMRNLGSNKADEDTVFLSFLDDDDYLLPNHLSTLVHWACLVDADVVWPWFRVEGGTDPFPQNRGRQWDPITPHIFPITTLVKKEAFDAVGGFTPPPDLAGIVDPNDPASGRLVGGEDWRFWNALSDQGSRFYHVDEVTWVWRHHNKNTSGLPERVKEMYG